MSYSQKGEKKLYLDHALTVYTGYDGLNRPLWENGTNSATGAWVTYTYDSTANGNDGIGHLTSESFTGSGGLSGSYAYTFDDRGQQTAETITVSDTNLTPVNSSYSLAATYNDNGQPTSQTYPTGEVVTPGYDNDGWLTGLSTQSGSTTTTIASNLAYSGLAGAAGQITTMDFGSGDVYTASFDSGMRLTSATLTQASTGELMYQTQPAYDAANNVVSVSTNISGATDTQQFCYDSLNRMTWAGSTGTPPCASLTPGTLTAAQYQQSYSFNVDSGLASGQSGSVTYGNSSHPHAITSTSSGYSAAYDAIGDETCRALSSATTCSGASPTGQQLSYDAEGRLTSWQNAPGNPPTAAVNYLYDGSGNRVAMQTTTSGVINDTGLTTYIGSIEEVQVSSGTTGATTTTYYAVGGKRVAANVNGTFYYFGYDALGSQVAVFNNSGNLIGSQLYGPYGSQRYSNGTLPTSIGFTGQQTDSVTGLDYYNARYYDPAVGQFLSADTVQGNAKGMDPYAYVGGNPETRTDPTGNRFISGNGEQAWIDPSDQVTYRQNPNSGPYDIAPLNVLQQKPSTETTLPPSKSKTKPTNPCSGTSWCAGKDPRKPGHDSYLNRSQQVTTSNTVYGVGTGGLQSLMDILTQVETVLSNPNGAGELINLLSVVAGVAAIVAAFASLIGEVAAGVALAGSLVSAVAGSSANIVSTETGAVTDTTALSSIQKLFSTLNSFKGKLDEQPVAIANKFVFKMTEVDTYGTKPLYAPDPINGTAIIYGYETDYSDIESAQFTLSYYTLS